MLDRPAHTTVCPFSDCNIFIRKKYHQFIHFIFQENKNKQKTNITKKHKTKAKQKNKTKNKNQIKKNIFLIQKEKTLIHNKMYV